MDNIESAELSERMRAVVSLSWNLFSRKVGNGLIPINKEASMQLQYAYILHQIAPLIVFQENESFSVELETGVIAQERSREIDILFSTECDHQKYSIAIEMKCYRTQSSSGGKRGATDIFMKDVYEDLYLLEQYVEEEIANEGVALVMNDLENFVHPKKKEAKCWDYDISHEASFGPVSLSTPIGGKDISINLKKCYKIAWAKVGEFWFLEAQGKECNK